MEITAAVPAVPLLSREQQLQQWREQRSLNKMPTAAKSVTHSHAFCTSG